MAGTLTTVRATILSGVLLAAVFAVGTTHRASGQSYLARPGGGMDNGTGSMEFNPGVGLSVTTTTHHHRFGSDNTGIGSSNSQTTSATVEDQPKFQYHPTGVNPALTPIRSNLTLESNATSFSGRMSSPALRPLKTGLPGFELSGRIHRRAFEARLPAEFTGDAYSLFGLQNVGDGEMMGASNGTRLLKEFDAAEFTPPSVDVEPSSQMP